MGGGASRDIPAIYKGWKQDLLDIDPNVGADIICDAKLMHKLKGGQYDAVYCSHNLEHFYQHEVPNVVAGFSHVLVDSGFAHVGVPDMMALFEAVVSGKRDINDVWYVSSGGPIRFHDVIYGWGAQVQRGNLFYCHKTGFSERSLTKALKAVFKTVFTARDGMNLHAFAFKTKPSRARLATLGL